MQLETVPQHKAAIKEIVEGQKSKEGERSDQAENPEASPETENKHDASTNTQVSPENRQPDSQEVKNKTDSDSPTQNLESTNVVPQASPEAENEHDASTNTQVPPENSLTDLQEVKTDSDSPTQNLESTNVVPASPSSEISTTPAPQDKGNATHGHTDDHDQKTAFQVSDSTTKNGDIQQENSHTPSNSQQQHPLQEDQSVAKDTKIKNTSGMITRSQSAATRINTSTSTDSSATLPQNANLQRESAHGMKSKHGLDKETPDPKRQKTVGQDPASSGASSSCSPASPKTPSIVITPIQETIPGGGSSAGQVGISGMMEFTTFLEC